MDIAMLCLTIGAPIVTWYVKLGRAEKKEQDDVIAKQAEVIAQQGRDLAAHRLYASETFVRKDDMKELRGEIQQGFRRLENKIDGKRGCDVEG